MRKTSFSAFAAVVAFPLMLLGGAAYATKPAVAVWYRFSTDPLGKVKNGSPLTGAVDSGPNHLNGTASGSLFYSSNVPPHGKPLSLNATMPGIITVSDAPALDLMGSFTLSAWAEPTGGSEGSLVGDSIANKSIGFPGNCIISYGIYYNAYTGQFFAEICGSSNADDSEIYIGSADTYALGSWHMVAMKYVPSKKGSATLSLYVDSKLEAKKVIQRFPGIYYNGQPFQIASEVGGWRQFIGYVDEVKLTTP